MWTGREKLAGTPGFALSTNMPVILQDACDENVIRSGPAGAACSKTRGRWILAATILASSMAFIDSTVVNVALPALQTNLNATAADVQWVIESYALLLSALLLVGGSLGDHYGRRRVFVLGVMIFAVASALCGFAGTVGQLIAARAVQGIGAALLVPGSLAIISNSFSEQERGRAIGVWSGFSAITAAIGPVFGGWLIEHVSWRAVFFINLPLAVRCDIDLAPPRRRELAKRNQSHRLARRNFGSARPGCIGLRTDRIVASRSSGSVSDPGRSGRRYRFDFVFVRRIAPFAPNVAAHVVSLADIRWDESFNISTLCCARRNSFFPAVEFDSGSALFPHCGRSGAIAVHTDHVASFALVRRTGVALWSENSTYYWSAYHRSWIFAFPATRDWRQLLDKFLSAGGCSGIRHGRHRGAAYHDRDELAHAGPCRDRIGSEQRRCAHGESRGDCSSGSGDDPCVQDQSGSQTKQREFVGVRRAVGTELNRLGSQQSIFRKI
jgi:MFS family permease